ncbi:hypothetical protein Nepgr_026009 [Nepenthes gracilis]|uniref:RING-type E3 ubiquitin transferase n=1 Tax=Nepenthes gracilis TaxID=150966 RepID=A0AAD3Y226_NEPGR|nr:hypothetical protein Nepgr_026009 [Nepenthes gracilis]
MAILQGKLSSEAESITVSRCFSYQCAPYSNENWKLYPPPSPPSDRHNSQNHVVPYLIFMVCLLGVAFLFLTTCTILLRNRWARRNSIRVISTHEDLIDEDNGPVDHHIWHIAAVGLQQSVIDSITAIKYKKHEGLVEGSDCSVCLTEFQDGDDIRILPKCCHAFHISCIDTWLRSHKNCPLCRALIINESSAANFNLLDSTSGDSDPTGVTQMDNLVNNFGGSRRHQGGQGETSDQMRGNADGFGILPIESARIASILKKNRELRVLSDLGENHRATIGGEGFQPVRRSVSLDAWAASAMSDAMAAVCSAREEGSSGQAKEMKLVKADKQGRENRSVSRLTISGSIGHSLHKAPASMKRSFSSSGKFLSSFRRSKIQTSILPL